MTTSQTGKPAASENGYERARSSGLSRDRFDGESPEALRRRADILLDEMMLGGVDLAAGEFVAHDAAESVDGGSGRDVPYDSEDRSLLTPSPSV